MPKVCIDPGHGGADPGATNPRLGLREKDMALDVALLVKRSLENAGVSVVLTRNGDYQLVPGSQDADLTARAQVSNRAGADLFLSVHMNGFGDQNAHGMEVYSCASVNTPGLAKAVYDRVAAAGMYTVPRGTKRAAFAVLERTNAEAALIEMAFITNDKDAALVRDHKDAFADAIAGGICDRLGVPYRATPAKAAPAQLPDMPIVGKQYLTAKHLADYLLQVNPQPRINCTPLELANHYLAEGAKLGLRGDIAMIQAFKEAGYFKFGGQVKPEQNNYAGIGATNGGAAGATFATPLEGVKAHLQHLFAYASDEELREPCVDPRFNLVTRKSAPNWGDLSGRWAWPGYDAKAYGSLDEAKRFKADYGSTIIKMYADIKADFVPKEAAEYPAMDNTPDGWAAEAIEWAKEQGYLKGDPNGNLRLHDGVTRQELYAVLKRFTADLAK